MKEWFNIFLKNLSYHVSKYIQVEDCHALEDTYWEARNAEQKNLTSCNLLGTKKEFKGKEFNNKQKGGFQRDTAPAKPQDGQGGLKYACFNCVGPAQAPDKNDTASATNTSSYNIKIFY